MAAEDELAFPDVPEAKPDDPEDVSWALSTAEAMWARGDHLEGIKWVRKAAEAASDAENDERHLELAKAASELASMLTRRSQASVADRERADGTPQAPPASAPTTARSGSVSPPPAPSSASRPPANAASASAPPTPRSVPPAPIPLPSHNSSPPAPKAPVAPRAAPRPVAALATSDARQGPQAGRGILSNRSVPEAAKATTKSRRRSRENLDAEAKAAGVLDTAPQTAVDGPSADRALVGLGLSPDVGRPVGGVGEVTAVIAGGVAEGVVASARSRRRSRPDPEPTIVGHRDDLLRQERAKSAEAWDASPTENLTGDDMDRINEGDRKTFALPSVRPPSIAPPAARATTAAVHDPGIQTSQAVRVVVWRDGNGVHIAPAGTVVSSITIDAVLVVLEPSADLTAWLSQRER